MNYTDLVSPRYFSAARVDSTRATQDTLRLVSFNVKYALQVPLAIQLLRDCDSLRGADVILLQEMDEAGVQMMADSMGMGYVYYPASLHPRTGRDFGNAILSRWPIEDDRKIILPHLARYNSTQRAAVGATIIRGNQRIRVYSVHLATLIANGPNQRRAQLAAVLADADSFPLTIIGGDFNSETVADIALGQRLTWPTRKMERTNAFWTFDHLLLRGFHVAGELGSQFGIVRDTRGASDHRPVWANLVVSL